MKSIDSVVGAARALAERGVAYASQIAQAASEKRLDPRLLAAVAAQETGGPGSNAGRNVVGDGGHGRGLFQIDDRYHSFARTPAAMNPQANARYAASMIAGLLSRYKGNLREALSAYNAGDPDASGTMTQWQDGKRLDYADSVLRHYAELGGTGSTESVAATAGSSSPPEQPAVDALSAFASMALPAPSTPQPGVSYRQLAGLDDSGNAKQPNGLGEIVNPDSAADDPLSA